MLSLSLFFLVLCTSKLIHANFCFLSLQSKNEMTIDDYLAIYRTDPSLIKAIKSSDPYAAYLAASLFIEEKGGGRPIIKAHVLNAIEQGLIDPSRKGKIKIQSASMDAHYKQLFKLFSETSLDNSWRAKFARNFSDSDSAEFHLRKNFEYKMAFEGVGKGLEALGFKKDTRLTRIQDAIRRKLRFILPTTAVGADAYFLYSADYTGLFLPGLNVLKDRPIPDNLWERGIDNGFETVKEELASHFKNRIQFQIYYERLIKIVNIVTLATLTPDIYDDIDEKFKKEMAKKAERKAAFEAEQQLRKKASQVDLTLKYDWSDERRANEQAWEAKLKQLESAKGIPIDRNSPKWIENKARFMEYQLQQSKESEAD